MAKLKSVVRTGDDIYSVVVSGDAPLIVTHSVNSKARRGPHCDVIRVWCEDSDSDTGGFHLMGTVHCTCSCMDLSRDGRLLVVVDEEVTVFGIGMDKKIKKLKVIGEGEGWQAVENEPLKVKI